MTYDSKKARFLLQDALEYKGLYRTRKYKKLARRNERRNAKRNLSSNLD